VTGSPSYSRCSALVPTAPSRHPSLFTPGLLLARPRAKRRSLVSPHSVHDFRTRVCGGPAYASRSRSSECARSHFGLTLATGLGARRGRILWSMRGDALGLLGPPRIGGPHVLLRQSICPQRECRLLLDTRTHFAFMIPLCGLGPLCNSIVLFLPTTFKLYSCPGFGTLLLCFRSSANSS